MKVQKSTLLLSCALGLAASAGYGLRVYAEGAPTTKPIFYAGTLEEQPTLGAALAYMQSWARWQPPGALSILIPSKLPEAQGRAVFLGVAATDAGEQWVSGQLVSSLYQTGVYTT